MNKKELITLLSEEKILKRKIDIFMKKKVVRFQEIDKNEIKGHIQKAEHNLRFVLDNIKLDYLDWAITGCYYSVYHSALALILKKGYVSKNHDATLCILVFEYYNKGLEDSDLELINDSFLNYQDFLFYVRYKDKREEASYSTKILYNKEFVMMLRKKTINFIDKVKNILDKEVLNE